MRKDRQYTITGHKKYSTITLHPVPNSSNWQIWFDGTVRYNQNEFTLNEALQHVETWRRQYKVIEEDEPASRHLITTPMPSKEDVARVLGRKVRRGRK